MRGVHSIESEAVNPTVFHGGVPPFLGLCIAPVVPRSVLPVPGF